MPPVKIATVQSEVSSRVARNGKTIRRFMKRAHDKGAHIVHFCEGALSGYTAEQLMSPDHVNFTQIRMELASIQNLAKHYGLWVVLGSSHESSPGQQPHNSLYVISDQGTIAHRYDKRLCSHNEIINWYTPGSESCVFDIEGVKFSCLLCIEVNFPTLWMEANRQLVDCILFSSYSKEAIFGIQCQGYAASYNYFVSMSIPKNTSKNMASQFIGPDGCVITKCVRTCNSMIINDIDITAEKWKIPLRRAKPWRKKARGKVFSIQG